MGLNIDWTNEEIEQLALNLNNIGLHLRNSIACMYNTCTRLANNNYWVGKNFNIVAKKMNEYMNTFVIMSSNYYLEIPSTILKIAKIQAEDGGGTISTTINAEGDQDLSIKSVPLTQENASGDQIINIEEVNKFLEDPGTAVSIAFFVHGSDNDSVSHYLRLYIDEFDKFYNAIEKDNPLIAIREQLQSQFGQILYKVEEFLRLVNLEASMAKGGIEDTNEDGIKQVQNLMESQHISMKTMAEKFKNTVVSNFKLDNLDLNNDGEINSKDQSIFNQDAGNHGAHSEADKNAGNAQFEEAMKLDYNGDGTVNKMDQNLYVANHLNTKKDDPKEVLDTVNKYNEILGDGKDSVSSKSDSQPQGSEYVASTNPNMKDYNNDGKIDNKDEKLYEDIKSDVEDNQRKELYDKLDVNKDGVVDGDDIRKSETWDKDAEEYHEKYGAWPHDVDRNGSPKKSANGSEEPLTTMKNPDGVDPYKEKYNAKDENGDGKIDMSDVASAAKKQEEQEEIKKAIEKGPTGGDFNKNIMV